MNDDSDTHLDDVNEVRGTLAHAADKLQEYRSAPNRSFVLEAAIEQTENALEKLKELLQHSHSR